MDTRLTVKNIEKILKDSEGVEFVKEFSSRNFSESAHYIVENGVLYRIAKGKTSWADSRYVEKIACSIEQTRRVIRNNRWRFNTSSLYEES